ncbi:Dabb family protein [Anaerolentibacter hominis]|uniref:Dabb family protein n=1 Tax=Anaerolentibacter hominis TaxID=3079009 RepID=UPI0031B82FD5
MVRHVVMFRFAEEAEGRSAAENGMIAKEMLLALKGKISELKAIEVGVNMAEADAGNYTVCLTCDFDSMEDLSVYAVHPEHLKVVEFIKKVNTSRACVDYTI